MNAGLQALVECVMNVCPKCQAVLTDTCREVGTCLKCLAVLPKSSAVSAESRLVIPLRTVGPANDTGEPVDYQLIEMIGKGSISNVWSARQQSTGRTVALKLMRPEKLQDQAARDRFLLQAVVLAELEHPSFVPICDVGRTKSNELFIAMRRIRGMPWDRLLGKHSLQEALDIWMRVADGTALAHSRGVVLRDIRPEQVMVGEFGEVQLMGCGMARLLPMFRHFSLFGIQSGSTGVPAYMAPEMIGLGTDLIGPWSDVYLLGAVLYEIAAGFPPHGGKTVLECIQNAQNNSILPFDGTGPRRQLVEIALRAMSTRPADRHRSVSDLQSAVHAFLHRQESDHLADQGELCRRRAEEFDVYDDYARAIFSFEEALSCGLENERARLELHKTRLAFAEAALRHGDLHLGTSVLTRDNPTHKPVLEKLEEHWARRFKQTSKINQLKFAVVVLGLLVAVGAVAGGACFLLEKRKSQELQLEHELTLRQLKAAQADVQTPLQEQGMLVDLLKKRPAGRYQIAIRQDAIEVGHAEIELRDGRIQRVE